MRNIVKALFVATLFFASYSSFVSAGMVEIVPASGTVSSPFNMDILVSSDEGTLGGEVKVKVVGDVKFLDAKSGDLPCIPEVTDSESVYTIKCVVADETKVLNGTGRFAILRFEAMNTGGVQFETLEASLGEEEYELSGSNYNVVKPDVLDTSSDVLAAEDVKEMDSGTLLFVAISVLAVLAVAFVVIYYAKLSGPKDEN